MPPEQIFSESRLKQLCREGLKQEGQWRLSALWPSLRTLMTRFLRFARGCRGRASTTLTVLALLAASPLIGAAEARAQGYLFSFTKNVGTGPDPSGGVINPWLQALVEDVDVNESPGLVKITLTPNFSDPENFVSYVGFSIDPFVSTTKGAPFCTSLSPDYDCADSSFASAGNNGVGFREAACRLAIRPRNPLIW
jgi:hypothetical protein